MFEFEPLQIDTKAVEKKLKNTSLKMPVVAKKMMNAVNREVIKQAKANFKKDFNPKNHSWQYDNKYKGKIKPTLSSFKYRNDKYQSFVSYVRNYNYASVFNEYGAEIEAKNEKYLNFKVNGQWVKVKHVTIPARPFIKPAITSFYETDKARVIMDRELNKILNDYWNKEKDITETASDNATKSV